MGIQRICACAKKMKVRKNMRIYIVTDMEGSAGIINFADWVTARGKYYEQGKIFLTEEINACIRGFCDACDEKGEKVEEILVVDGHGEGGINTELLDSRASLARNWSRPPYPFSADSRFDVAANIGQHAKAGSEYSHITHTGWFNVLDMKINGISVGEYGCTVFTAGELGVPMIYASGERAFCKEAAELTPWTVTTEVKRGVMPGKGDECTTEQYMNRNLGAVHLSPIRARELIYEDSKRAMEMYLEDKAQFEAYKLDAPYKLEKWDRNGSCLKLESDVSVTDLLNKQY